MRCRPAVLLERSSVMGMVPSYLNVPVQSLVGVSASSSAFSDTTRNSSFFVHIYRF
jgi:hypothetical protein